MTSPDSPSPRTDAGKRLWQALRNYALRGPGNLWIDLITDIEAEAAQQAPAPDGLPVVDASCDCEACTTRTTEMYEVPGACGNCGQRFMVRSRKGDKTPLSVECPACEVTVYGWRAAAPPSPAEPMRRPHNHWLDSHHWQDCPGCDDGTPQRAEARPPEGLDAALLETALINVALADDPDDDPSDGTLVAIALEPGPPSEIAAKIAAEYARLSAEGAPE